MPGLLAGIGTWIADRWLQTVVLSGMLWVATLVVAARLGQSHPFDAARLHTWLDEIASQRAGHSPAAILLAVAAALLTAGAAGLAAGALGALHQRLWGADGSGPVLAWLPRWRRRWWQRRYSERARRAVADALAADLAEPRDPVLATARKARAERALRLRAEREPHRPTRIGDTLHAVAVRLRARYDLDLDLAWPRLWAVLDETLRADLAGARAAYDSAARLAGWSVLYTALTVLWWPAALIGAGVFVTAVARARGAAAVLASLVEAAVDLRLTELADQLGVRPDTGELTELGQAVGRRLGRPTRS